MLCVSFLSLPMELGVVELPDWRVAFKNSLVDLLLNSASRFLIYTGWNSKWHTFRYEAPVYTKTILFLLKMKFYSKALHRASWFFLSYYYDESILEPIDNDFSAFSSEKQYIKICWPSRLAWLTKGWRGEPVAAFLVKLDVFTLKYIVFLPHWRVPHITTKMVLNILGNDKGIYILHLVKKKIPDQLTQKHTLLGWKKNKQGKAARGRGRWVISGWNFLDIAIVMWFIAWKSCPGFVFLVLKTENQCILIKRLAGWNTGR